MKKILLKLLGQKFFNKVRSFVRRIIYSESLIKIKYSILCFLSKSKFLAKIYYFFNSKYDIEFISVLSGRQEYLKQYYKNSALGMLRRNIHRLEKGLIMRPMRNVYALDYLVETVEVFATLSKVNQSDSIVWARDVLVKYFSVVDLNNPIVNKAHVIFEQIINESSNSLSPEQRNAKIPSNKRKMNTITFQQLSNLYEQRCSVRWFTEREFDDENIDNAIKLALTAPSACNRQPFRFIVLKDKKAIEDISALAGGTAGFSYNIPKLIVVIGDLSNYELEKDRHLIYIDSALASMQFCLAVETLGGATCCINWSENNLANKKAAKYLNLNNWERVIMLIAVGYEDETGLVPYSQKKDLIDVRSFV